MSRDDQVYLTHILEAATRAAGYIAEAGEEGFKQKPLVQDGVIRQIEIIGEAAKRVSPAMRSAHPEIPRQDMAGMRDKLIHDYFGVDITQVWLTATKDLPLLAGQIAALKDA
jgi:uncharacterized protein with HEPN domain